MKTSTYPDLDLRVSNNYPTKPGRGRGGAGARSKDEKSAKNPTKRGPTANDEVPEAMPTGTVSTPAKQAKRRDQKATPTSHATTKAKEIASRDQGKLTAGTDPITDLTGASGGTGHEQPPLGKDDLASASKVLFVDGTEGEGTQGSPKSFLQYDTEDEALEAALAEAKAAADSKSCDDIEAAGLGDSGRRDFAVATSATPAGLRQTPAVGSDPSTTESCA